MPFARVPIFVHILPAIDTAFLSTNGKRFSALATDYHLLPVPPVPQRALRGLAAYRDDWQGTVWTRERINDHRPAG